MGGWKRWLFQLGESEGGFEQREAASGIYVGTANYTGADALRHGAGVGMMDVE